MFNRNRAMDMAVLGKYFISGIMLGCAFNTNNSTAKGVAAFLTLYTLFKAAMMQKNKEMGIFLAGAVLGMIAYPSTRQEVTPTYPGLRK